MNTNLSVDPLDAIFDPTGNQVFQNEAVQQKMSGRGYGEYTVVCSFTDRTRDSVTFGCSLIMS